MNLLAKFSAAGLVVWCISTLAEAKENSSVLLRQGYTSLWQGYKAIKICKPGDYYEFGTFIFLCNKYTYEYPYYYGNVTLMHSVGEEAYICMDDEDGDNCIEGSIKGGAPPKPISPNNETSDLEKGLSGMSWEQITARALELSAAGNHGAPLQQKACKQSPPSCTMIISIVGTDKILTTVGEISEPNGNILARSICSYASGNATRICFDWPSWKGTVQAQLNDGSWRTLREEMPK